MKVVNLLEFINSAKDLFTLDYARCDKNLINFLDLMTEDEQFTQRIDFGIVYVHQKSFDQYIIVDGLNRILSLSLLLHAVCECYKKTTERNTKAIKTIRNKYLIRNSNTKLHLNEEDNDLYNKIINGERLSGHEKAKPMFILLHNFWSQIKEEKLQASKIFAMLQKVTVTLVETDDVSKRNLYYKLNISSRELSQIALIEDFLRENGVESEWHTIRNSYFPNENDVILFLKDFFVTKFHYKQFNPERLYESFVNYFETMMQYMSEDVLIRRLKNSAKLYYNILNINFNNDELKRAIIQIKKHSGEDTYAYILDVYEDYAEGNISESIFLEILKTIDEYLQNRQNSGKNIEFNELIQYLNAFITCK